MTIPNAVVDLAGQPATIRVGVVVSTSPLRVNVQGTLFEGMGLIGATPSLGANVLMLGQSVRGANSSGSSWVIVGTIVAT